MSDATFSRHARTDGGRADAAVSARTTSIRGSSRTTSSSSDGHRRHVANLIIAQLLFLERRTRSGHPPLHQHPGGRRRLGSPSTTRCSSSGRRADDLRRAGGVDGAVLLAAARRQALRAPERAILIHQPWGGRRPASDIAIQAKEILRIKDRLNQILANHTKQPLDKIVADADGLHHGAELAKEYGIVDHVIARRER